jgi:hypothetical protein
LEFAVPVGKPGFGPEQPCAARVSEPEVPLRLAEEMASSPARISVIGSVVPSLVLLGSLLTCDGM